MTFDDVSAALEKRGYAVSVFATAKEAADYLDQQIDGVSVSFGRFADALGDEAAGAVGQRTIRCACRRRCMRECRAR